MAGNTPQAAQCRVLILGGIETWKSSLANVLLGREAFQTSRHPAGKGGDWCGTQTCQSADVLVQGIRIQVVDTPALIQTQLDEETVLLEAKKCVELTSPGPHVFLFMFRLDSGFNEEDYKNYQALRQLFGGIGIEKYTIIVFSGIESLGGTPEEQERSFMELIRDAEDSLLQVVNDVQGRCVAINTSASAEDREQQAAKILAKIQGLVLINGGHYSVKQWGFTSIFREIGRVFNRNSRANLVEQFLRLNLGERKNVQRVVLLGKTGAGKSSLGNTLLELMNVPDQFRVERGLHSGTLKCQWKKGREFEVIDTPGLCDTRRPNSEVLKEIAKCVALAAPGPHVILMVLRCDRRFTAEEYGAYVSLKKLFGDNIKNFMIIVFVGMEVFGDSVGEQDNMLQEQTDSDTRLRNMKMEAGGRYIGVSNVNPEFREVQASRLRDMMKGLVGMNDPPFFCTPLYNDVNKLMKDKVLKRLISSQTNVSEEETKIKQAIVDEQLDEGFLQILIKVIRRSMIRSLGDYVAVPSESAAANNQNGELSKKCSVM